LEEEVDEWVAGGWELDFERVVAEEGGGRWFSLDCMGSVLANGKSAVDRHGAERPVGELVCEMKIVLVLVLVAVILLITLWDLGHLGGVGFSLRRRKRRGRRRRGRRRTRRRRRRRKRKGRRRRGRRRRRRRRKRRGRRRNSVNATFNFQLEALHLVEHLELTTFQY
jgi:hypothetical protein